jgi:hypothetical protein
VFPLVACAASGHADIFQWEYINPADPSDGKQQSTTLAPDGDGALLVVRDFDGSPYLNEDDGSPVPPPPAK